MNFILNSLQVEIRRLTRSGLLAGLLITFAFFGLSGPTLALYMPKILATSTKTDQVTMTAADPTPVDGIALFNQSAMQLGLILAVTVAITSLGWDVRPGSSSFYRTRTSHLIGITLPRLGVDWIVVAGSHAFALGLAAWQTQAFIGPLSANYLLRTGMASITYMVMAMNVGYLIMAITRRTATAIAVSTILMLVLPLANNSPVTARWSPTALLGAATGTTDLIGPYLSAGMVFIACLALASWVTARHGLRREA